MLNEDILVIVFSFLDHDSLWTAMNVCSEWARIIGSNGNLMLKFNLKLTPDKYNAILKGGELANIPFRNVSLQSYKGYEKLNRFGKLIYKMKKSIEILILEDFRNNRIEDILCFFSGFSKLRILTLINCCIIEEVNNQILKELSELKEVKFERCDGNFFKIFQRQTEISKITVRNTNWTWNGFSHDEFSDLLKTLPKIDFVVLDGAGTGSYFDCDNFGYHIRKLDTTMITFHWYVGIRTARKQFLEAQKNHLKELTIHQLPYDFDGGNVIKFIIEEMNLEQFYYRSIPLIKNKEKYPIREFEANEIQVCATFEMFRQFPTIIGFKLKLSQTDVDSTEIERVVNPHTELFRNVQYLEIQDNSGYRRILGIFLGLIKNFRNIRRIKIQSQDGNINVLLQEFLPVMTNLREIYIDTLASRVEDRLNIIRNYVPNLSKLSVAAEYVQQARNLFQNGVEIYETEIHNEH